MSDVFAPGSLTAALSLVALALLPLALMTLTSFAKVSVVLSALRNALGASDVPSAAVITALAFALSVFVMAPLAAEVEQAMGATSGRPANVASLLDSAREPLRRFLSTNAGSKEKQLFVELSRERGDALQDDSLPVLWAAFALHEIKQAFYLGFFVFLPFLVLDFLVANVLLALGLHGLTPQAVALPFKLLLFVAADGFVLVSRALVLSYN